MFSSGGETGRSSEPWSLCITPGPDQVIFAGSVGRAFKIDLDGKVLGTFGLLGRLPGWFDSIHALAIGATDRAREAIEACTRKEKSVKVRNAAAMALRPPPEY